MSENGFDLFGMTGNPFKNVRSEDVNDISLIHSSQQVDELIGEIKDQVFALQKKEAIILTGSTGIGKTHRLIVAAYEANVNGLFCAFQQISEEDPSSCYNLARAIMSTDKYGLLNSPKWYNQFIKIAKKVRKNKCDPKTFAQALANALNVNKPSFLLIDNLHKLASEDNIEYVKTLEELVPLICPGVLIMITCTDDFFQRFSKMQPVVSKLFYPIKIPLLNIENAKKIVGKRVESTRLVNNMDPIYPFDNSSISHLYQACNGNPSRLIEYTDKCISYAINNDALAIDESVAVDCIGTFQDNDINSSYESQDDSIKQTEISENGVYDSHIQSSPELPIPNEVGELVSYESPGLIKIPSASNSISQRHDNPDSEDGYSPWQKISDDEESLHSIKRNSSIPTPIFHNDSNSEELISTGKNNSENTQRSVASDEHETLFFDENDQNSKKNPQSDRSELKTNVSEDFNSSENDSVDNFKDVGNEEINSKESEIPSYNKTTASKKNRKKEKHTHKKDKKTNQKSKSTVKNKMDTSSNSELDSLHDETNLVEELGNGSKNQTSQQTECEKEKKSNINVGINNALNQKEKNDSSTPSEFLEKHSDSLYEQDMNNGRNVTILCPECNEKFSYFLKDDTLSLTCPNCGFEGEL